MMHKLRGYDAWSQSAIIAGMTDTTGDATPDATRHDVVTVNEAAEVLGITPDSVRARLRRGSLAGEKIGDTWRVHLGEAVARHDTPRDTTSRDTTTRHDTTSRDTDLEPLAAVIRDQTHRIEELAAAAAFWQVRAQQAEDQLKQLTAGEIRPESPESGLELLRNDPDAPTGVLAWVRRLWGG